MRRILAVSALALAAAVLVALPSVAAKPKLVDLFWVRSDAESLGVKSITLLPAAAYDNSLEYEKLAEMAWGQCLRGTGYRWISGGSAREILRQAGGGDSLLKVVHEMVLKDVRVDSLAAPALCARFRTRALLSLRLDLWEQHKPEWNESGKSSTTMQLHAALVDSLGRLLWTASGSEFAEGPMHEPVPEPPGSQPGVHGNVDADSGNRPPEYAEVVLRLLTRWAPQFPARAPAPAGAK